MTTSSDLLDLVYQALSTDGGATDAGGRVYKPGDWPTQPDQYPILKLRLIGEDRVSQGRASVQFTTTAIIRIIAEVSAPATLDDAGATGAETALWRVKRQVEVAIVNSYPLFRSIQQLASVRSQLAFNSEGATHLAGIQMDLSLEFYEGPEDFAPIEADEIDQVSIAATHYPPARIIVDQ